MKLRMFRVGENEKCGCCNWETSFVYMLGETKEDAKREYNVNERGLCGECIAEMLMEEDYKITKI